jgi:FkbM family methyltransferase
MGRTHPDRFLRKISGVVHVGANIGQERGLYDAFGLRVIWIEPVPEIFEALKSNLRDFPDQRAIQCLVTDRDDAEYPFHIANNKGESSSILELKHHRDIWPEVNYTGTVLLKSSTLTSLLKRERVNLSDYQGLVLDTQGAELLVLKGSVPLLSGFMYIKAEVPDFEAYAGCCRLSELDSFMTQHGYVEFARHEFAGRPAGGSYFNIVYRKKA